MLYRVENHMVCNPYSDLILFSRGEMQPLLNKTLFSKGDNKRDRKKTALESHAQLSPTLRLTQLWVMRPLVSHPPYHRCSHLNQMHLFLFLMNLFVWNITVASIALSKRWKHREWPQSLLICIKPFEIFCRHKQNINISAIFVDNKSNKRC